MVAQLFAHPMTFDIQIAITIYNNWEQTTRRNFYLRNLSGESELEQVAHAKQILDGLASELHYLTRFGVDKGIIKVAGRKVEAVVYPDYKPPQQAMFFIDGVRLDFAENFAYYWQKEEERRKRYTPILPKADWNDSWQRVVIRDLKKKALRIPCIIGNNRGSDYFFQSLGVKKRGRKVVGWSVKHDPTDAVFQQFIGRFEKEGNLSLGNDRAWIENRRAMVMKGIKWGSPKRLGSPIPQKSQLASQPRDDTDYVYLIQMGQKLVFKIGKTNDPQGRLASLQTASPYKLKLVHFIKADNASAVEETLHRYFQKKRMHGEWFQLTKDELHVLMGVTDFREERFLVEETRLGVEELFNAEKGK